MEQTLLESCLLVLVLGLLAHLSEHDCRTLASRVMAEQMTESAAF